MKHSKKPKQKRRTKKTTRRSLNFKRKRHQSDEVLTERKKANEPTTLPNLLPGPSSYTPFIPNDDILRTIKENRIKYPEPAATPKAIDIEFQSDAKTGGKRDDRKKPSEEIPKYIPTKLPESLNQEYDIDNKFKKRKKANTDALPTSAIPNDSPYWYPAIIEAEPPTNPKYNYHDRFVTLSDGLRVKVRRFKDGMIMILRKGETKYLRLPTQ